MKAVHIVKPGPPETLEIVDLPVPEPKDDEVLVNVNAAGVNFADILMRTGLYRTAPARPFVPGFEVSGTVERIGKSVSEFSEGQRITGLTDFAGYAEYAVCKGSLIRPLIDSLTFEEGASIPVNWLTAYHCLYFTGPLDKGYKVLVHAAAGGVGIAAIQMLKKAGCSVIGLAGTEEKIEYLRNYGVDCVINYRRENFSKRIIDKFGLKSIDIVLDSYGGKSFKKEWKLLKPNGRIISLGVASIAGKSKLSIAWDVIRYFKASILHLIGNSQGIYGVAMQKIFESRPDLTERAFDEVMQLIESGTSKPVIDSTYSINDVSHAHSRLESGKSIGKVVLTFDQ